MPFSRLDTPEMIDAYRQILLGLRSVMDQPMDAPMTSHWPVVGGAYSGDLLIVGQAVFGWIPRWSLVDLTTDEASERILDETRSALNERPDPMSWIATNSHRTSPFWRTAHLISDALSSNPAASWYSRIAWTNLYPVSRQQPAGNPYGDLLELQTSPAASFLATTVAALQPRLVIVLAGPYWWPFADELGFNSMRVEEPPLLRSGEGMGAHWLVGWHPAGAQRRRWRATDYAAKIVTAAQAREADADRADH